MFFHLLPHLQQHALYEQARHQPMGRRGPQNYFFYTANNVHQTQVPIYNCPSDPSLRPGVDPVKRYAPSSYAANYLVFGNTDVNFANRNAQGKPRLAVSFPDGTSHTILFAEKYAAAWIKASPLTPGPSPAGGEGSRWKGGCHWAYFQADCYNPLFGYFEPTRLNQSLRTDINSVGPRDAADTRNSHFQVRPNANGGCNPCLPATGHAAMNVCMSDASVRSLAAGIDPVVWWSLVTPAGGEPGPSD